VNWGAPLLIPKPFGAQKEARLPDSEQLPVPDYRNGPQTSVKDPWYRRRWVVGLAGFMLGGLVVTAGQPDLASTQKQLNSATGDLQAVTQERDELRTQLKGLTTPPAAPVRTAPVQEPAAPAPTTFSDGVYKVGTDIKAGTYRGTTVGDRGYWEISTDANGNDIVANDNVTSSFYLAVKKGQYLKLNGVEIRRAP
jgi:hypothetical protein